MKTQLPTQWKVKYGTHKNWDILKKFQKFNSKFCGSASHSSYYGFDIENNIAVCGALPGYKEITFEEFKILVLGEQPPQPSEPSYEIY